MAVKKKRKKYTDPSLKMLDKTSELIESYQDVFDEGDKATKVLNDLMDFGCFLRPIETEQEEGRRQVVLRILQMLNTDNSKIREMLEEKAKMSMEEDYDF